MGGQIIFPIAMKRGVIMNDRRYIDRRFNKERRVGGTSRRSANEREGYTDKDGRSREDRRVTIRRLFHRREGWISI